MKRDMHVIYNNKPFIDDANFFDKLETSGLQQDIFSLYS